MEGKKHSTSSTETKRQKRKRTIHNKRKKNRRTSSAVTLENEVVFKGARSTNARDMDYMSIYIYLSILISRISLKRKKSFGSCDWCAGAESCASVFPSLSLLLVHQCCSTLPPLSGFSPFARRQALLLHIFPPYLDTCSGEKARERREMTAVFSVLKRKEWQHQLPIHTHVYIHGATVE